MFLIVVIHVDAVIIGDVVVETRAAVEIHVVAVVEIHTVAVVEIHAVAVVEIHAVMNVAAVVGVVVVVVAVDGNLFGHEISTTVAY